MENIEDKLRRTRNEWEEAHRESERVRRQFMAEGSGPVRMPERILDTGGIGMKEIQEADRKVEEAWEAHQEAIKEWKEQSGR